MAIHQHLPLIGAEQSDHKVEGGGLSGSVWTKQPDHLTRLQVEGNVRNQLTATQSKGYPIKGEAHGVKGVDAGRPERITIWLNTC